LNDVWAWLQGGQTIIVNNFFNKLKNNQRPKGVVFINWLSICKSKLHIIFGLNFN